MSDIPGLATITDPALVNPWGISQSPTSPFWTSNQGTNTSTLYAVTGGTNVVKVNVNPPPDGFVGIPTTTGRPAGADRSGQQHQHRLVPVDARHAHHIRPFHLRQPERHHFRLGGRPDSTVEATTPGAVYTGLAINAAQDRLYAANSAGGRIDVFDSSFAPVSLPAARSPTPTFPPASSRSTFRTSAARLRDLRARPDGGRDRGHARAGGRGCVR